MKNFHFLLFIVLFVLILFVTPAKISATSWAYPFVVWEDYIYVISDEYVVNVGEQIGEVTKFSDMKSYAGNFSNAFKKGTEYYSINGISTDVAIAIKESDGLFKKAYREGEYELQGVLGGQQVFLKAIIFILLGISIIFFIYSSFKRNNRKV